MQIDVHFGQKLALDGFSLGHVLVQLLAFLFVFIFSVGTIGISWLIPSTKTRLHLLLGAVQVVFTVVVIQAGRKIGILVEVVVLFESFLYHMIFSRMALINHAVRQNHHFSCGWFSGNMFRPDLRLDVKVFVALLEG